MEINMITFNIIFAALFLILLSLCYCYVFYLKKQLVSQKSFKGIGIDILEISRMALKLERRGDKLAQRILTKRELEDFKAAANKTNFLAKRFAAKEAVAKALGTGFGAMLSLQDIEIQKDNNGRPFAYLTTQDHKKKYQYIKGPISISISDEKKYVVATAIIL